MPKKANLKNDEVEPDITVDTAVNETAPADEISNMLQQKSEELENIKKELESKTDMLYRTAAEFDNFKKREAANKEKLGEYVKGQTIKELLPSIDNINRALSADVNSPEYAKGISMTVKGLYDALKSMGLEEINPTGEEFDVNLHQAVMRVEDDTVGANIVTEVLQMGYKLGDYVLRHAMVKVANCE